MKISKDFEYECSAYIFQTFRRKLNVFHEMEKKWNNLLPFALLLQIIHFPAGNPISDAFQ